MSWQRLRSLPPGTLGLSAAALVIAASLGASALLGSGVGAGVAGPRPCNDTAATNIPQPSPGQMAAAGLDTLPVAPPAARVDLAAPKFSDSTTVTNPLFPISKLESVVLNGRVDGKPFRTETTLLPDTRVIEWTDGQCVKVLVSQYTAYLDGRIDEVALDLYAQADDGSVWYFGEDVFNYNDGVVEDTGGTWLAGKEGPAAMIMPGAPKVGNVHRPENIPGLVFEEVAVASIDQPVSGPRGGVAGALVGRELHDDGSFSDKTFAPGYGEFRSAHDGDLEALALAVPTDAVPGPTPVELQRMASGVDDVFRAVRAKNWARAGNVTAAINAAWRAYRATGVPPRLIAPTDNALKTLRRQIAKRASVATRHAALDVLQAGLDLQLRHRSPVAIDRARFDLWLRQMILDATVKDSAGVHGDIATLEWIRDRIARATDAARLAGIDSLLKNARTAANDERFPAVNRAAVLLRRALEAKEPPGSLRADGPATSQASVVTLFRGALGRAEDVDHEHQRVGALDPGLRVAARAVPVGRRDNQEHARADRQTDQALVPAGDDLTHSDREPRRFTAVPRGVELLAGAVDHTHVVGGQRLPLLDGRARSFEQRLRDELRRRRGTLGDRNRRFLSCLGGHRRKSRHRGHRGAIGAGRRTDRVNDVDDEHHGVRPLDSGLRVARRAIALVRRKDEQHPAADRLADELLVPSRDDPAHTDGELRGLATLV